MSDTLEAHRAAVRTHFTTVFGEPGTDTRDGASAAEPADETDPYRALWQGNLAPDDAAAFLHEAGFADAEAMIALLGRVRSGGRYAHNCRRCRRSASTR